MQEEAWKALGWIRGALLQAEPERLPEIFRALYPEYADRLSESTQRLWLRYKIGMLEEAFQSLRGVKERGEIPITDMLQQGNYRITALQADGSAATIADLDGKEFQMPPFQKEGDAETANGAGESAAGNREIEGIDGVAVKGE